ncbi:CubicO group peptidase, beta-lactamase class C family [bacterium A37T11]|nr:CubicO group peptidase, beta-lactamase class C family [bacterium A37T11]
MVACGPGRKEKIVKERQRTDSLRLIYDPANADKRIDAFMQRLHSHSGFNGNVLVAKKGKIIYENCFGWADYLHRDSLKIDSRFELASISKTMTGIGILMLVEKGKLKLDQTVNDFYPDFPYPGITIKQLLSHRSGLPNYVYFTDDLWPDKKKGMSNQDVMKLLIEKKPAAYSKPDARFFYNNSNFMVLAAIIEKVTGETYTAYMKENVFNPAGMNHTVVYSKADYEKIPVDVVGHDRVFRRSVVQDFHDGPVGDKGTYSTVEDLFLLNEALNEGRLLKKETLDSAYKGRSKPIKDLFNYGYGWRTFTKDSHQVVYHTGWWHGFRHIYVRDLSADITIVLLSNLTNGSLTHLDELYQILGIPVIRQGAYGSDGDYVGE